MVSINFTVAKVDQLFAAVPRKCGQPFRNPVTGANFIWGLDPTGPQKKEAIRALDAATWFKHNSPSDAPPLPLTYDEVETYRGAGGLKAIVGFYARSLSREGYGRKSYETRDHPAFNDFACGLMVLAAKGRFWGLENDAALMRRFPPRELTGMTSGAYWVPPKEYKDTIASYGSA